MILRKNFKYIDLFSGIGGFHLAMNKYSNSKAKCVLASEIDEDARRIYTENFGMEPMGDIKKIDPKQVDRYDVICAGFPCQPFSKAGYQKGFADPRGTLFNEIIRFLDVKDKPKILILENVRNLISHDNGITWNTIKNTLIQNGYNVVNKPIVCGPKDFGIPQLRDRAIILAVRNDIYNEKIEPDDLGFIRKKPNTTHLVDYIDSDFKKEEELSEKEIYVLDAWDDFIKNINKKTLGFPVWYEEFGKTYDYSDYPSWKQDFVIKNRKLYLENKKFIDKWSKKWKVDQFTNTNKKFEWQMGNDYESVYNGIIQFRPSGIRVKRPTESPTLVAMVHIPIIGWQKRRLSIKEAARLQSFPENYIFNENKSKAYKQLGNAVNVEVIYNMFKLFIDYLEEKISERNY